MFAKYPIKNTIQPDNIASLENLSWWPFAPFWLLVLLALILLTSLIVGRLIYRRRKKPSHEWQQKSQQKWLALRPINAPPREQITFLSILLRRVAIQYYGREACAGLSGEKWLAWLTKHDPQGFDWTQSGRLLIESPNMPPDAPIDESQVDIIVQAVCSWMVMTE